MRLTCTLDLNSKVTNDSKTTATTDSNATAKTAGTTVAVPANYIYSPILSQWIWQVLNISASMGLSDSPHIT